MPLTTGHAYVLFDSANDRSAQISGEAAHAASGEVAGLYAQQFPFAAAPAPVASLTLQPAGAPARYTFRVTPTLVTRYDVEVFSSSTATTPVARSAVSTVYVTTEASSKFIHSCTGGICVITATVTIDVPASVIRTEMKPPLSLGTGPMREGQCGRGRDRASGQP